MNMAKEIGFVLGVDAKELIELIAEKDDTKLYECLLSLQLTLEAGVNPGEIWNSLEHSYSKNNKDELQRVVTRELTIEEKRKEQRELAANAALARLAKKDK